MTMGEKLLIAASVFGILAVFAAVAWLEPSFGDGISGHGWFAYALGSVLTLVVAGGLFWLLFHSARHGYDDIDRDEDGPRDD